MNQIKQKHRSMILGILLMLPYFIRIVLFKVKVDNNLSWVNKSYKTISQV